MNDHDLVAALREALEPLRSFEPQQPPQGAGGWAELMAEVYRRRGEAEDAALRVIAEVLGGEGSEVPTHSELARWTLQEGPDPESPSLAALAEESDRLTALLGSEVQPVYLERAFVTVLQPGDEDRLVDDSVNTRVDEPVQVRWEWKPHPEDPIAVMHELFRGGVDAHMIGHPPAPDGWSVMTRTIRVLLEVVELWCDRAEAALEEGGEVPKLPGARLVKAWQVEQAIPARTDRRGKGIFPGVLGRARGGILAYDRHPTRGGWEISFPWAWAHPREERCRGGSSPWENDPLGRWLCPGWRCTTWPGCRCGHRAVGRRWCSACSSRHRCPPCDWIGGDTATSSGSACR